MHGSEYMEISHKLQILNVALSSSGLTDSLMGQASGTWQSRNGLGSGVRVECLHVSHQGVALGKSHEPIYDKLHEEYEADRRVISMSYL